MLNVELQTDCKDVAGGGGRGRVPPPLLPSPFSLFPSNKLHKIWLKIEQFLSTVPRQRVIRTISVTVTQ